jgi:uncharacterized NAD(P)/FAD-binding protein YdhS
MALVGSTIHAIDAVLDVASTHGSGEVEGVARTGHLPQAYGGHLPMKLFRWRELSELVSAHGDVVAAAAAGLFKDSQEHHELLANLELDLGAEPGAIDAGRHILAVVQV